MTKRPRKNPPATSRGSNELRNRLAVAVAILATAGLLLWKPWAPSVVAPAHVVAALTPPAAAPTGPAEPPPPKLVLPPAATETSPAPQTATAAINPPVPPLPPVAPRMPATLEADFDAWLIETYRACWTPPGATPDGDPYYPRVRVALKADGTLASQPKLLNPPYDPAWKPHAEAAVKAVKACDPLKVPDKFAPYHAQWKTRTVFFDPTRS